MNAILKIFAKDCLLYDKYRFWCFSLFCSSYWLIIGQNETQIVFLRQDISWLNCIFLVNSKTECLGDAVFVTVCYVLRFAISAALCLISALFFMLCAVMCGLLCCIKWCILYCLVCSSLCCVLYCVFPVCCAVYCIMCNVCFALCMILFAVC